MKEKQEYNSPTKNSMRDVALGFGRPSNAALLFPGPQLRCLDQGVKSGMFDPKKTSIICIEKKPDIAKRIKAYLEKHKFNYYLHEGNADKLDPTLMRKFLGEKKLDFAFFDFCNTLNLYTAEWLGNLSNMFKRLAKVSFTFAVPVRTDNSFLPQIDKARLYPCLDIDPRVQYFDKNYQDDGRSTVIGTWMAMSVNYQIKIASIHGYVAEKAPMLLINTVVTDTKSILPKKYFWNMVHAKYEPIIVDHKGNDSQKIGCHPLMNDKIKRTIVKKAKEGFRPDWLSALEWQKNPLNPYRKAA